MDGIHDLGGRQGFGHIPDKNDSVPFHAEWEARAFGMEQSSASGPGWSIDWFRHCRELIVPVDYLTCAYFDQWLLTLAAQMIDAGYLTLDEIRSGRSAANPQPAYPPATAEESRAFVRNPKSYSAETAVEPAFAIGDIVRAKLRGDPGHTRLPGYVRGKRGTIFAHHGGHLLPDASAKGEKKAEHLYTVSFAAAELWPEAQDSPERVFVDLWESYLDPG